MKKVLLSILVLVGCLGLFAGCSKNSPQVTAINPTMSATIGTYNFTAATVVPSTLDTQYMELGHVDTVENLYITGHTTDLVYTRDYIRLRVSHYDGLTGTFPIAPGAGGAVYYHNGVTSNSNGGIVVITRITSNSIIGYFSFTTFDGISVTNGVFTVGLPDGTPF